MPLTVPLFVAKWKAASLSERSSYQQHFLDLCSLLDVTPPAEEDPTGASFTFEKGVTKADGGKGFADVWRRGCFGWEYKGKHKDLDAAYRQLQNYREALENPPLLVVCDLETFVVRTNFTGTPTERHEFHLDDLADTKTFGLLRNLFHAPYELRPGKTQKEITEKVAAKFAKLADGLRGRGVEPEPAASAAVVRQLRSRADRWPVRYYNKMATFDFCRTAERLRSC